jgi:hypothetical protein
MRNLAFDIETATNDTAPLWFADVEIEAPSNYKDPEKIAAYIAKERSTLISKGALKWWTGRIISYAIVNIYHLEDKKFFFHTDEKKVLEELFNDLSDCAELWGKSSIQFDVPFLIGRYMANKMTIPFKLTQKTEDIDQVFGYSSQAAQRGSLDAYMFGMGIKRKQMSGSLVPKMFDDYMFNILSGNKEQADFIIKELEEYNLNDAIGTAEMVRRYRGVYEAK